MVSSKAKGNLAEKLAQKMLEDSGFVVMRSPRTMRMIGPGRFMSMANDYWGLYDLCAKKDGATKWIQVKSTSSGTSEAKPKIAEFHEKYNSHTETSEIWQKVPRKGFVIYSYSKLLKNWEKIFLNLNGVVIEPFIINKK